MKPAFFAMTSLWIMTASAATVRADDRVSLPSGQKIEGELIGEKKSTPWIGDVDSFYGYMTDVPVALKAGDKISIRGTVTGRGRKISIALLDPTGTMIAATARNTHVASAQLVADEVNATGDYVIRLVSDRIGAYSLIAVYPEPGKAGRKGEGRTDSDDPSEPLRSGQTRKGELTGERKTTPWLGFVDSYYGHMTDVPVTLKAGDKITIRASVTGKDRKVAVALLDPSGEMIEATARNQDVGGTQLIAEEVNATGKYLIRVVSDRIGSFSVTATFPEAKGGKSKRGK